MSERVTQIISPSLWAGIPRSRPNAVFDLKASEKFTSYERAGQRDEIVNTYTTTPRQTTSLYGDGVRRRVREIYDH